MRTQYFFLALLKFLGKFRNCHGALLKNLLYFWPKFNVLLGLVGQICPSLAMIGLSDGPKFVYPKPYRDVKRDQILANIE